MSPVVQWGHIVFVMSVCWFVGWTTLTLVITFEPFEMEPLYLACRFLGTRASHSYKKIWPLTLTLTCDLLQRKQWPWPGNMFMFHKHIFLVLHENICCGYLLEVPHFHAEIRKISILFGWKKHLIKSCVQWNVYKRVILGTKKSWL